MSDDRRTSLRNRLIFPLLLALLCLSMGCGKNPQQPATVSPPAAPGVPNETPTVEPAAPVVDMAEEPDEEKPAATEVVTEEPTVDSPPAAAAADVPYQIALDGFTIDGFPGLHSYGIATEAGKAVLFAGRTNGLHGFAPDRAAATHPSFPKEFANNNIYVIDLEQRKLLGSGSVDALPTAIANQFKASNVEYNVQNGWLYVVGGYGPDPGTGSLVTLPQVTAVNLSALITAVEAGTALDQSFADANMATVQHPALAITGGDLQVLGDQMLLVFGHKFDGEYTLGGGQAFQAYSNAVRLFAISAAEKPGGGVDLSVEFNGTVPANTTLPPDNPYHRRDLTVRPAINAQGQPQVVAYGGVFKGGRMEGYLEPVYIDSTTAAPGISLTVDTAAEQLISQYDCAAIQLHEGGTMYTTLFGGISYYYWDGQSLKHDTIDLNNGIDGLPFINSVSTFRAVTSGDARTSAQFLHVGTTFPPAGGEPVCGGITMPFCGSETKFVINSDVPQYDNGVIKLDELKDTIVIGYLVGGIASEIPYASQKDLVASCASNVIYQVTLDPNQGTPTVKLVKPKDG